MTPPSTRTAPPGFPCTGFNQAQLDKAFDRFNRALSNIESVHWDEVGGRCVEGGGVRAVVGGLEGSIEPGGGTAAGAVQGFALGCFMGGSAELLAQLGDPVAAAFIETVDQVLSGFDLGHYLSVRWPLR